MKHLIVLLWMALFITACEYQVTDYPPVPATSRIGAVTHVYVAIHWVKSVDDFRSIECRGASLTFTTYECASWTISPYYPDTASCDLYALKPRDFMDVLRLALLGHGLLHCLDWQHESAVG